MTDIVKRLRALCHPMAEAMPDGARLTAFVHVGTDAADEIERLRAALARMAYTDQLKLIQV